MTKLRAAVLTGLIALTGACSSSSGGTGKGGAGGSDGAVGGSDGSSTDALAAINVMVSGAAAPHPLTMATDLPNFTMLTVAVVDPAVALAGGAPLAAGPLDTSAANCTSASASDGGATDGGPADAAAASGLMGCAWSFPSVNIAGITLGLVGIVDDQRAMADAGSALWVRTGTGAGTAAFIAMDKISKAPITGRQLFVVSKNTQTGIAALASGALVAADAGTAFTGEELQARGYMIGHVVGRLSEGAPPVAGATVAPPAAVAANVDIIYPTADLTGVGTSTSANGIFFAIPKPAATPAPIVASWTVTPPTSNPMNLTWQVYTAGTQPGAAFVLLFLADEAGG